MRREAWKRRNTHGRSEDREEEKLNTEMRLVCSNRRRLRNNTPCEKQRRISTIWFQQSKDFEIRVVAGNLKILNRELTHQLAQTNKKKEGKRI